MNPSPRRRSAPYFTPICTTDDPERLQAAMEKAGAERNLLCPQYDACLDQAAAKKWPGFDCLECEGRHHRPVGHGDPWRRRGDPRGGDPEWTMALGFTRGRTL